MMRLDRRPILTGFGSMLMTRPAIAQGSRSRVVLPGTKGGPTPGPCRAAPATAILVHRDCYLIDCGSGVAQQMAKAGIAPPPARPNFVAHNHSDHVADAGTLTVLARGSGMVHPRGYPGPPPLAGIVHDQINTRSYRTRRGSKTI